MTGASAARKTGSAAPRAASRGRIDKREAILSAAFTVFSQRGYARACMEEIAEVAGVAKHTVYNHLGDKENVFRSALEAAADTVMAENLAVVELLTLDGHGSTAGDEELRATFEDVAHRLLLQCCDDRSWALRRLLYAEVARFPELLEIVWGRGASRLQQSLADRLARLSLAGRLRTCDPAEAAEQFLALLTGPMERRSRLGTHAVDEEELRAVAGSAVRTFLLAYRRPA
ncbi:MULTISPECIES: TetR/AcrR family transcriptional regulator [Streptomyces]|uniref:TetR/AcrR family transcriptional regulator n=1 Tax=Streptomyces TaxID=1883 RepID=UPI001EFAB15D|nr:TetR/AcrR family transcriptional regulator [Streptomyces sp. CL12-4]MCG8971679.1 TetR/AcrR family transcriptional regulator [Streptomyces sp. CL12-4]